MTTPTPPDGGLAEVIHDALIDRTSDHEWADEIAAHVADAARAAGWVQAADGLAWEAGVRQAIAWLRADYEYGTGPDWRENGAEWIAERLTEHRREATP